MYKLLQDTPDLKKGAILKTYSKKDLYLKFNLTVQNDYRKGQEFFHFLNDKFTENIQNVQTNTDYIGYTKKFLDTSLKWFKKIK